MEPTPQIIAARAALPRLWCSDIQPGSRAEIPVSVILGLQITSRAICNLALAPLCLLCWSQVLGRFQIARRALFWLELADPKKVQLIDSVGGIVKALTLIASKTTVTLGKVTVTQDNPLAKDGWLVVADFAGSKHYGHGPTCQDALDDLVIRHGVQIHEVVIEQGHGEVAE